MGLGDILEAKDLKKKLEGGNAGRRSLLGVFREKGIKLVAGGECGNRREEDVATKKRKLGYTRNPTLGEI